MAASILKIRLGQATGGALERVNLEGKPVPAILCWWIERFSQLPVPHSSKACGISFLESKTGDRKFVNVYYYTLEVSLIIQFCSFLML